MDWDAVEKKQMPVPFIPPVGRVGDFQHFNEKVVDEGELKPGEFIDDSAFEDF